MGTRIGINRNELAGVLFNAKGDVAIVTPVVFDSEIGMHVQGNEPGDTMTVEVDGTPDEIGRLIEAIDHNHTRPKPAGWFR